MAYRNETHSANTQSLFGALVHTAYGRHPQYTVAGFQGSILIQQ